MVEQFVPWIFLALEIVFFAGVLGCVLTVVVSWIEIVSEGFSKDQTGDL